MIKKLIYTLLDLLTFGKGVERTIGVFRMRIPARYFRYYPADYESQNMAFVDHTVKSGMTVLDIGGHIGLFAVAFGQKVGPSGKVLTFEPTPSTFNILQKTVQINSLDKVVVPIKKAVSDSLGVTTFYISDIEAHNSNSLANNKRENCEEHAVEVELTTVDAVIKENSLNKVDFIKIDAEGAELSVLKGAVASIKAHRPVILLALHPPFLVNFGVTLEQIWNFIADFKYEIWHDGKQLQKDEFTSRTGIFDVFLK